VRIYERMDSPWRCGFWNGSPLEVLLSDLFRAIPASERYHYHDYHEYYIVLHGRATLRVEGRDVPLLADTVVMVQPGERHRVVWVDPELGVRWVVIKERSHPEGKIIVPEPEAGQAGRDGQSST
jgi:mannose-6-phosphate isomerase-like protein (cupin superfamily)